MKGGYLQQKSTGFRSVERKKHTQQDKWNIHWYHAPLANRDTTAPKVTELMKSASKEIYSGQKKKKKIIISHNSFFHSSNSYINLCRLLESARLTRFSLLARPKGQPVRSWAWHSFLQKSCLNARGTWWEVDACKFARGEERRYTWHGSWEQLFVSTHCSLLLFKSEDEQVLRGTGWVLEQIRANIKGQTRRAHATADTQCSSEYSLFLRYTSSRAVLYVWFCFWFTLWLRLDLCLIDLFHFKAHKATFMATAALPHASIPHQHCRGPCSQLSLSQIMSM